MPWCLTINQECCQYYILHVSLCQQKVPIRVHYGLDVDHHLILSRHYPDTHTVEPAKKATSEDRPKLLYGHFYEEPFMLIHTKSNLR